MSTMNEEVMGSLDGPIEPITDQDAARVRELIASHAQSTQEARMFEQMLGVATGEMGQSGVDTHQAA